MNMNWKSALILAVVLLLFSFSPSSAGDYVDGYLKKSGTYVAPYYRSTRDGNTYNNWSTKGNTNPYTGKRGGVNSWSVPSVEIPTPAPRMFVPSPGLTDGIIGAGINGYMMGKQLEAMEEDRQWRRQQRAWAKEDRSYQAEKEKKLSELRAIKAQIKILNQRNKKMDILLKEWEEEFDWRHKEAGVASSGSKEANQARSPVTFDDLIPTAEKSSQDQHLADYQEWEKAVKKVHPDFANLSAIDEIFNRVQKKLDSLGDEAWNPQYTIDELNAIKSEIANGGVRRPRDLFLENGIKPQKQGFTPLSNLHGGSDKKQDFTPIDEGFDLNLSDFWD